jgi:hypothetical protein
MAKYAPRVDHCLEHVGSIEVRVSPHDGIAEMALDPRQHLAQRPGRCIRGAGAARLVHHPQALPAAPQRNHQRLVGPPPIVAEVRPFLLLAVEGLDVPVEIHQRKLALASMPPRPPRQSRPRRFLYLVDHSRELLHRFGRLETAQKISGRRRVWNPARSHQPAHRLAPLQRRLVFEACPVGVQRVRERQHVIRLVVRRVSLEQLQRLVESLSNSKSPHKLLRQDQAPIVRHLAPRVALQVQQGVAHHAARGLGPWQLFGIYARPRIDVTGAFECDRNFHSGALPFEALPSSRNAAYTSSRRAFPVSLTSQLISHALT